MAKILIAQKTFTEMFGVMSLAAVLKERGHTVAVSTESGGKLLRDAREFAPDIAAFSAVSMNIHANLQNAAVLKRNFPSAPIVIGGVHTTFFPDAIENPNVDAVCRGEGEFSFAEYAEKFTAGEDTSGVAGFCVKKDGRIIKNPLPPQIENLDSLPFPDRDVYYSRYDFLLNNPVKNFLCSRGCPYNCSFCFNQTYRDLYSECGHIIKPRMRSPENVIAEIEWFRAKWPLEKIAFQDENFCLDKKWLHSFLELYSSKIGLPFFCMLNAAIVDEDLISALKTAGCHHTTFGVESGDEHLRRKILNKVVTDEKIRKAAELLKKHEITFHTTNIFCFPGETVESAIKTIRFNAEIQPDSTIAFRYMPFANLELTKEAVEKNYLRPGQPTDWKNLHKAVIKVPGYRRIYRLRLMFGAGVKKPALIPLIVIISAFPVGLAAAALFYGIDAVSYYFRNRHNLKFMIANIGRLGRLYRSFMRE